MESVQVEVKIELGHTASCRKRVTNEGFTHDWLVFVRGPANCDISHFVEKVVFYLHESFAKPKRVLKEPPYQVGESGYGSFFLPIEVYFKNKDEPRKVVYNYDLFLPVMGSPPIDNIRSEALTFKNPTEEFKRKLLRGGGVVTSVGSHNGFRSTLSPANSQEGSMDTKEGKSTLTYLPEGHNPAQTLPPVQETDKTKNKVVGNKTVKTQESTVSGVKRPVGTLTEDVQTQPAKKKKKKPDEGTPKSIKTVGFIPLDLPAPGSELKEKLDEAKDIKLKIKSLPSKPVNNKKEKKISSSDTGSSGGLSNSTKRRDSSSSTKKVKQKEDSKQTKLEDKKLEKITFRRGSGDSWSSSTSSSSLAGHSSGKNPALNALLAEIENGDEDDDEDDDDDEVDIFTPFQSSSLHSGSVSKHVTDNVKSTNGTVHKKDNNTSGNSQLHKGKSKGSAKKVDTSSSSKKNGLKSPSTESNVMMSPPSKHSPKPRLKDSKQGSNGQQIPSKELVRLYKRLVTLKDSTLLQEIADILETTGRFVVTDTTLDFDLCSLDKTTIKRIESSIGR